MLALFKNNQAATALVLAVFAILVRLPGLLGLVTPDTDPVSGTGLAYQMLFGWASESPRLSAIAATVLVYVQALLMNWLVNQSRVNPDRNWLVSLLYVLLTSCIVDFQYLSAPLVAATFLPVAYRLLFHIYKSNDTTILIFDIGLLISTAALFYLPSIWLLPVALLSILHLRSLKINEIGAFVAGAITPGFLGWAVAFLYNQGGVFRHAHFSGLFEFWDVNFAQSIPVLSKIGLLLALLLVVFFGYSTYYYKRLIQIQKYNNLLYWLIFAVCAVALLRHQPQTEHFLLASTAVSIFWALSFQSMKNKGVAEVLFFALLGTIFTVMFVFR